MTRAISVFAAKAVRVAAALAIAVAIYWGAELALLDAEIPGLAWAAAFLSPISIFGWLTFGLLAIAAYAIIGRVQARAKQS